MPPEGGRSALRLPRMACPCRGSVRRRLALPVVQLGDAGLLAQAIVRIGLVVAAANRTHDLRLAGIRPCHACAGLVALAAATWRELAEGMDRALERQDAAARLRLWFRRGLCARN